MASTVNAASLFLLLLQTLLNALFPFLDELHYAFTVCP